MNSEQLSQNSQDEMRAVLKQFDEIEHMIASNPSFNQTSADIYKQEDFQNEIIEQKLKLPHQTSIIEQSSSLSTGKIDNTQTPLNLKNKYHHYGDS